MSRKLFEGWKQWPQAVVGPLKIGNSRVKICFRYDPGRITQVSCVGSDTMGIWPFGITVYDAKQTVSGVWPLKIAEEKGPVWIGSVIRSTGPTSVIVAGKDLKKVKNIAIKTGEVEVNLIVTPARKSLMLFWDGGTPSIHEYLSRYEEAILFLRQHFW